MGYSRRTRTVSVEVDVEISDFEDEDIREEYRERFGSEATEFLEDGPIALQEIRDLLRLGRDAEALEKLRVLIRDAFGDAI